MVRTTEDEAKTVVLNQEVKYGKNCGFTALALLAKRYNPKTPARVLQALMQVSSPAKPKDIRQIPRVVEEWEAAKGKLKIDFGE